MSETKQVVDYSLRDLLEAGVHFGHQKQRWNPKMKEYIYGVKNGVHILDLTQTYVLLNAALQSISDTVAGGGRILFVGTKKQASLPIAEAAEKCAQYFVNHRWLGGMLTNWTTVKERIALLKDLEKQEADGTFDLLSKKEVAVRRKELSKLRKHLDGIKMMPDRPSIAIIIDQKREMTAIAECRKLGIPVVSILDTNCDPDLIDIPIPGNDDAVRSIKLILNSLTDSILRGQAQLK